MLHKKFLPVLGVSMAALVGAWIVRIANQPARGTITTQTTASADRVKGIEVSKYEGKTFSLSIPRTYTVVDQQQEHNATTIENVLFSSSGIVRTDIVVTVQDAATLDEVPGHTMRTLRPDVYEKDTRHIADKDAVAFVKRAGGFEQVTFVLSKHRVFTIACRARGETMEDDCSSVLGSFTIRE